MVPKVSFLGTLKRSICYHKKGLSECNRKLRSLIAPAAVVRQSSSVPLSLSLFCHGTQNKIKVQGNASNSTFSLFFVMFSFFFFFFFQCDQIFTYIRGGIIYRVSNGKVSLLYGLIRKWNTCRIKISSKS